MGPKLKKNEYFLGIFSYTYSQMVSLWVPYSFPTPWACADRVGSAIFDFFLFTISPPIASLGRFCVRWGGGDGITLKVTPGPVGKMTRTATVVEGLDLTVFTRELLHLEEHVKKVLCLRGKSVWCWASTHNTYI